MSNIHYGPNNCSYARVIVKRCDPANQKGIKCANESSLNKFLASGRLFLFLKNNATNGEIPYYIENFFVIPDYYKRLTVEYQVVKT